MTVKQLLIGVAVTAVTIVAVNTAVKNSETAAKVFGGMKF